MIPPKRLNDNRIRFCRLHSKSKKPFEKDWPNKLYTYEDICKFEGENYGILCGPGEIAVIDSDKPELQAAVDLAFPKTYMVKTPGGGTHNYYFVPGLKQKMIIEPDGVHLGEVQSHGTQVVGPGSIHPNGGIYTEMNQNEIAVLPCELLYQVLGPFLKKDFEEVEETAKVERQFSKTSAIDDLSVLDIWGAAGMKKQGDEYYGCHPKHGSSGGMNFWINPMRNTWHCFRCNSGGGPLSAIAVKEGLIDCSEAHRGNLRGDKAIDALNIARTNYGLKDRFYDKVQSNYTYTEEAKEINIIWEKDLKNYEIGTQRWILDKLIPTKSICVLSGKRGTMKSFVALQIACCVARGKNFLDQYQTEVGPVIYLDKENGTFIMKERMDMIKRGMKWEEEDFPIGFICFSSLRIDSQRDIISIEEVIKKHKPMLLIVDTYRRAIGFDENDAGEVSKLFVETLRPLVDKYDFSVLFIHHHRKSSRGGNGQQKDDEGVIDEMDEMRGSSDFANYVDSIIKVERKSDNLLVLKQLKNRNAPEEKPIKVGIQFNTNSPTSLNMHYAGAFIPRSIQEKCADDLEHWITINKIKSFTTKEASDFATSKGYKDTNFKSALQEMMDRGQLNKVVKGKFEVAF